MNILILAGGTGSIALQTGLHGVIRDLDGINIKVLTNAYDNGLSTGAVRQVMGGEILGPSDVRKNQTTLFKLLNNGSSPWNNFLDIRFTKETSVVRDYCLGEVASLRSVLVSKLPEINRDAQLEQVNFKIALIKEAIEAYFKSPQALRIDYNDFSLANIVYAGFARANGNSLRRAASIMAKILDIPDNVIVNDDKSMFLGAVSKSGQRVTDEGDIVFWGKEDDPFVDVFFTDHNGKLCTPVLCDEAKTAIDEADLIILSSGTQWSSLIPTYASLGFKEAIENASAKIIMVMNKVPDKDCPGQTSADIIDALVPKYFPESRLHVMIDSNSDNKMQVCTDSTRSKVACWSVSDLSSSIFNPDASASLPRHNPSSLATAIISNYFEEFSKFDTLVLDYDDTLVGRGNTTPKSSEFNRRTIQEIKRDRKFSVAICTGNSIKAIKIEAHSNYPLTVYADGGINQYNYIGTNKNAENPEDVETYSFVKCIDESNKLPRTAHIVMSTLNENGIPMSKMENRGDAMIAIKPVDENYRDCIINLARLLLKDDDLHVRAAGRSTVEIVSAKLSKASAIKYILDSSPNGKVTYIGDELDSGNDNPVLVMSETNPNLICMHVSSPAKTALFLKLFNKGY